MLYVWRMVQSQIEPVSASKFPDQQGKYREFRRFRPVSNQMRAEKSFVSLMNLSKFPTQQNREFLLPNREFILTIREFSE